MLTPAQTATIKSKSRYSRHSGRGSGGIDSWRIGLGMIAFAVCLPILTVVVLAAFPEENIWQHLFDTVLPRYIRNTLLLMLGVGFGVTVLGVPTAWLVIAYEFPGRRLLQWILILPLAVPAYVIAYVYTDILEFAGPLQTFLRELFDWTKRDYWFPSIRSLGGAICMMSLVLYPYVYMLCRSALLEMSPHLLDAARVMGMRPTRVFFSIVIPVIRPALAVGVALALMETLNDFGTVDYFAVQTLTTGLFDTWLNGGNLGGAAQIALVMLGFVIFLLFLERISRHKRKFYQSEGRLKQLQRQQLTGKKKWFAFIYCLMPFLLGFVVPASILLRYAIEYFDESWTSEFRTYALNSMTLSLSAAVIAALLAVVVAYSQRLRSDRTSQILTRIAGLGYAMPGVVLALGLMIPLARFDNALDAVLSSTFGISTGLLLSGSLFAVIVAYVIRFLAISVGAIESSLSSITPSMEMAARTLGYGPLQTLLKFHLPLMRTGVLTAIVIVFVDCMKELPATLILRPFNFDTLAVKVYSLASDEMLEQSALGALLIVLVGLLPVLLLSKAIHRPEARHHQPVAEEQTGTTAPYLSAPPAENNE